MSAAVRKLARKAVAFGVVLVLTASTGQAVAMAAEQAWRVSLQFERSVQTRAVAVQAVPDDPAKDDVVTAPAQASWPAATTAEVDFASEGGTPAQAAARATGRPIRAVGTPVAVGLPQEVNARQSATGKVRVHVHDRKPGSSAVVFSLADAGGVKDKPLAVTFDYSSFAPAFGGDYAARLRLVSLPACAATTPDKADCQVATPVDGATNNTAAGVLSGAATLTSSEPAVFAAVAATGSAAGTYGATSLAPAGSWTAGGASGDFTYGYPMRVPPAIGGAAPKLSLGYSAQSLDGRTSSTNNQASWAGDGWDLAPAGFIERQYKPCSLDLGGNNGQTKTGDQCWATHNATISLVGVSGKLINIPGTDQWRAESDDGARIERLFGAANGDNNGEHWKVTTTDGTQYFLGLNRLPGWADGKPETQSAWTVPVFGNHGNEECNATTFDASWCQQAYRWNLDYSVDVHGNVTTYYYNREFNRYGRNGDANKGTDYVRGGWLDRVEYGLRSDNMFAHPGAKVSFETAERCLPSGAITCDPAQLNASTAAHWPDVPFDQMCAAGESCTHRLTPSFFTRKRLTKVVTRVANGASTFQDVDSWSLEHQFLANSGLTPALNLHSVTHTGLVGGSVATPPTVFAHTAMPNRVDPANGDNYPKITRYRLTGIINEAGGHTTVTYSDPDCVVGTRMPAAPEANTLRCYPSWWTPEGALEPQLHWFHKYVVVRVIDNDRTGASTPIQTDYEYLDDAAWHFDEAEFAEPQRRTWSQWRGYETVRTIKGNQQGLEKRSVTEVVYGRGMDGDKQPGDTNGDGLPDGVRPETITASEGQPIQDVPRLRGFVRETRQYNDGVLVSASVNDPYLPETPTATDAAGNKAFVTGTESVRGRTLLENGSWRRTKVDKLDFTPEGIVEVTEDHGDEAVTGDETCTRSTFVRNENAWLLTLASQVETVVGTCAVTASPSTIQSLARSYYDGQAHGAAPTRGLITKVEALDKWEEGSAQQWVTASQATYDAYGRPLDVYDARGKKTTTAYTPATGPLKQLTSTNPLGHVSHEYLEPAWGLSVASVDANNRRADLAYDALGRLVAAWTPGFDKATAPANARFEYQYNNDKTSVVVSKQLQDNGQYLSVYTLYDGLLRERQTQIPAPGPDGGRQITDTFYDSRGLPFKTNGVYWNNTAPAGGTLAGVFDNEVPNQTITTYDGLGRPTKATFRKFLQEQWHTTTTYGGDRVTTTPPPGGTVTTLINDAQGRTVEKWQHTGGIASPHDATKYSYNAAGLLETVTDPDGNTWSYTYDLRGRLVETDDPDTGRSTVTYDAAGQVLSSTDAENRTVANAYDDLGRLIAKHQGSLAGPKLASWEYDTAAGGGIGLLKSARRYEGNLVYHKYITGYDTAGRPKGQKLIVPASDGVLPATYELKQDYTYNGKPKSITYSAVSSGGKVIVPSESVGSYYNTATGELQSTQSGQEVYVSATGYSSFGEVLRLQYGSSADTAKNLAVTNFYEVGSRRPERTVVERETTTEPELADRTYTYDPAGNITKIADTPEGRAADTQCFAYDHLRRMTDAWTPSTGDCTATKSTTALGGAAPYWHSWTFDKTGNRRTETQHATTGDITRTTGYPPLGAPQPHTALSVLTEGPNGKAEDTFAYDKTGRTKSRTIGGDTQVLDYDAEGRVSRIADADGSNASTYVYDADGNRLISREPSATTLYVFGQEIRLEKGTTTPSWTRWYSHGGQTVAVRNSISGLKWLIPDHQGTNQLSVANDAAQTVTQRRQTPYGATRGTAPPEWPDRLGFVGGRNDESGLTQVGARLYDQSAGRFLSADPVIDNNDPQQLNGYAYANNSPVTYSDPTGLLHDCGPDGVLCGRNPAVHGEGEHDTYEQERQTFYDRQRAWQQANRNNDTALRNSLAAEGISWEDYQRALAEAHKTKWDVIKEVAWEVLKDISGWNDIVDCFSKGDIWACGGLVAGLVPWGKAAKILEAGYNAIKAVSRLAGIVDKAKGVLRRVQTITDDVQRVASEQFQKLTAAPAKEGCNSFAPGSAVVMADGSRKPIEQLKIGERVLAHDPDTGETGGRAVVATIVGNGLKNLVRLTVDTDGTAGDATGTVTVTEGHPFWLPQSRTWADAGTLRVGDLLHTAEGTPVRVTSIWTWAQVLKVHNLTVDRWHTYYIAAGAEELLNHNENCPSGRRENKQILTRDQSDEVAAWLGYEKTKEQSGGIGKPRIWKNKKAPAAERYIAQDTTGHSGGLFKAGPTPASLQKTSSRDRSGSYDVGKNEDGTIGLQRIRK